MTGQEGRYVFVVVKQANTKDETKTDFVVTKRTADRPTGAQQGHRGNDESPDGTNARPR